MTQKTVKQHTEEADMIRKHVGDANALLMRLRDELDHARETLKALRDFAPADRFKISPPYYLKTRDSRDEMSMVEIIKVQTARINTLLGDRAE